MAKRKTTTPVDQTAIHTADNNQPGTELAVPSMLQEAATITSPSAAAEQTAAAPAEAGTQAPVEAHAPIAAPPKGEGRSWTIDNRLGYRKEDSADGRKRQIRFADRVGGQRPDDETLAPVREKKPAVAWNPKEKSWQARKDQEGLETIDFADQELAELGRKRTGGQDR